MYQDEVKAIYGGRWGDEITNKYKTLTIRVRQTILHVPSQFSHYLITYHSLKHFDDFEV